MSVEFYFVSFILLSLFSFNTLILSFRRASVLIDVFSVEYNSLVIRDRYSDGKTVKWARLLRQLYTDTCQ